MSNLKEKIKAAQIDLIKDLGIDKLEPKQKEKIIMDIGEILQQRIVMRVVEELPEDKQDEFQGILEKAQDNPEALDEFIKENIPGIEDMILEEIGDYKEGALGAIQQATKQEAEIVNNENQEGPVEESDILKKSEDTDLKVDSEENFQGEAKEEINPEIKKEEIETKEVRGAEDDLIQTPPEEASKEIELKKQENSSVGEEPKSESVVDDQSEKKSINFEGESDNEIAEGQESDLNKKELLTESEDQKNQPEVSEIEKEQIKNEAEIIEENKIDNDVVKGEELDLSDELKKMEKNEDESKE
jgi:hypothetical protein